VLAERGEHHARLDVHDGRIGVEVADPAHVPGEVEHEARTDSIAGHRGPASPADNGRLRVTADRQSRNDVVYVAGKDDGVR
jgi:hypothetical protein